MHPVCRICLAGNMGMLNVKDMYVELYEKLSSYKLKTEGMPRKLCYACHRQLQKFQRFSDMAQKSNRILHYLIQNGTEITHHTVTMLPLETIQNLTEDPTRCTSGNNYQYERNPPITVKEEQPVVLDEATQTIEVHIKLEEVDENVVQENYNVTEQCPENYSSISDYNNMQPSSSSDNIDSKYDLVSHIKFYNEGKPFSCNVCEKTYTEKSSLTRHMHVHTGTKLYSCKKCSDVFHEKELLASHMQTHTENTNFFCKVCEKNFFDKCNLRRHMRVHTGERPYACNTCDKAFTVKGHLIAHMRIHTGERPYACSLCDKTFAENCNLRRHLLLHTGEKPYSCSTCSKTFTEKITLTRHLRIHTGEKPYFCQICDKTFSYKHNLTKHHVRIHIKKEADKETVDESKNPKCASDLPTTSDHIESK